MRLTRSLTILTGALAALTAAACERGGGRIGVGLLTKAKKVGEEARRVVGRRRNRSVCRRNIRRRSGNICRRGIHRRHRYCNVVTATSTSGAAITAVAASVDHSF